MARPRETLASPARYLSRFATIMYLSFFIRQIYWARSRRQRWKHTPDRQATLSCSLALFLRHPTALCRRVSRFGTMHYGSSIVPDVLSCSPP